MRKISSFCRHNPYFVVASVLCLLAGFIPHYLSKYGHRPPVGVYIAIMGLIAAGVAFREKPKPHRVEKATWIILMTLLVFAEIRNLYLTDTDQAIRLAGLATGIDTTSKGLDKTAKGIDATAQELNTAIANSEAQFRLTMKQLTGVAGLQKKTLATLQQEDKQVAEQLARVPLSGMATETLRQRVQSVAKQMSNFLNSYLYADREIDIRYYDYLEGHSKEMTQKQIDDWNSEEKSRRSELQAQYETEALRLVADANRLRAEMLSRIGQNRLVHLQVDRVAAAWFENPRAQTTTSFLYKLADNASYLDDLASRMTEAQPKP